MELETVVSEHADEVGFLWLQRAGAVHAPHYSQAQLADLDERLEAHIDGLRVAGEAGWNLVEAALENEGPEDFFPAVILAIGANDDRLGQIIDRAADLPSAARGVISALGWVDAQLLRECVTSLLTASSPFRQMLGIAACALHRKDPGPTLDKYLESPAASVRARALRSAGELGRADLLPQVLRSLGDPKWEARFWASRSAVLLGNRGEALDQLAARAMKPGARQLPSLQLALQAMELEHGHDLLVQLADLPDAERLRIIGSGWIGSIRYVPWLIEQMSDQTHARVAGEAFVNLTGADFNLEQLEAMPPEDFEDGPTEDPADENVEVPEDIALPWPDVERIKAWWARHQSRFSTSTRYFLGAPVSTESSIAILQTGFQRQRIAAAHHVSLLSPGTPLFNTSAPAWRQQRRLAQM